MEVQRQLTFEFKPITMSKTRIDQTLFGRIFVALLDQVIMNHIGKPELHDPLQRLESVNILI